MGDSAIDWCDKTWPIVNGCDRVSPECDNCWAAALLSTRLKRWPQFSGLATYNKTTHRGEWTGEIGLDDSETLDQPLRWRKPQRIFVAPYGDFFHEEVPEWFRDKAWEVMKEAKQHTFMLLTKQPENIPGRVPWMARENEFRDDPPWPNVWLGVTAGNQEMADLRIPLLLQVPAALHFVSCEPLLGGLDLLPWLPEIGRAVQCTVCGLRKAPVGRSAPLVLANSLCDTDCSGYSQEPLAGDLWPGESRAEFGYPKEQAEQATLGWVIGGGESGPSARPCHPDWARGLRDQAVAAGVPFMFKQWGAWVPYKQTVHRRRETLVCPEPGKEHSVGESRFARMVCVGKKRAGRLLDGVEWMQVPEVTT